MIYDLENKTQCELIRLLIEDLKKKEMRQYFLFLSLVKRALLLNSEKTAVEEMLRALENDCNNPSKDGKSHAHFLLGTLFDYGLGRPVDYAQAYVHYNQAIRIGNSTYAMSNLATMYQHGLGCTVNIQEAIRLYEESMSYYNDFAMVQRGIMHEYGNQFCPKNIHKALKLFEKAASLGNSFAMFKVACIYEGGISGQMNRPKARKLYEQAILLERNEWAMCNLALMHKFGQGGPVNLVEAARLYRRAAENPNTGSLAILGAAESPPIFHYHHAMCENNVQKIAALITNPDVLSEFIAFDCGDKKHLDETISRIAANNSTANCALFNALTHCEPTSYEMAQLLTQLKQKLLSKINIAEIPKENLAIFAERIIHLWYADTDDVSPEDFASCTQAAAQKLAHITDGLNFFFFESPGTVSDLIKNISLILVKNMYGKQATIAVQDISVDQMLLLSSWNNESEIPSMKAMNEALGANIIASIGKKRTHIPYPRQFFPLPEQVQANQDENRSISSATIPSLLDLSSNVLVDNQRTMSTKMR